jgi:D-cysteine desulfhydrase
VETNTTVTATHALSDDIPLFERFPALRGMPRVQLCTTPSPVERITGIPGVEDFWIKRDDLNAPLCGGNKVRALEFLLGNVRPGDTVLTLGGAGSTHVLSTAIHTRRIGAKTIARRWQHDMNPVADLISERLAEHLGDRTVGRGPLGAMIRSGYVRLTRNVHFIPIGGSTPIGALGHVNAGLELAVQIKAGALPAPSRIVLPVGSGGTAAGLALGLAIAELDIPIVGARVSPLFFANRAKVLRIARSASRLISDVTGEKLPSVRAANVRIDHRMYGGAYGRPLAAATEAAAMLENATGIRLDSTYSAKAFALALDFARNERGPTLFWLTFDARCLTS